MSKQNFKSFSVFVLLLSCFSSLSAETQYYKKINLIADSLFLKSIDIPISSLSFEARVKVSKNKERDGLSKSNWRLIWNYQSQVDYNYVSLSWNNTNYGDLLDERQCIINVVEVNNGNHKVINKKVLNRNVNLSTGFNTILIEANNSSYNVFVGEDNLIHIGNFITTDSLKGDCGLISSVDSYVSNCVISTEYDMTKRLMTSYSKHILDEKFSSTTDSIEGFWRYLDRNNDPEWTRLGGRYSLALVREGNDYLIIYIDGAETNAKNWHQGMIKGRLKATIFQNHYDLEWFDSMFEIINIDAHASVSNSILSLEFPTLKTQIRFYKEE